MYQLMKLQMLIGFALSLFKDLMLKYKDGKLTTIEVTELLPFIADITEFTKDLQAAKDIYTKLPPEHKVKLLQYLSDLLDLPDKEIEKLINLLFTLIGDLQNIFAILAIKIPPVDLVNKDDKDEIPK